MQKSLHDLENQVKMLLSSPAQVEWRGGTAQVLPACAWIMPSSACHSQALHGVPQHLSVCVPNEEEQYSGEAAASTGGWDKYSFFGLN